MPKRHLRSFLLLCLLVNAISGSLFQSWDQEARHIRHASCPACQRERPDALVSWDVQPQRDYLEPETSSWQISEPFKPDSDVHSSPYIGPYNRASGSGGASVIARPGGTSKRENPFTIGRNFDFDVAPAQTSSLHSLTGPLPPYQRFPHPRSSFRTQRKPHFHDPSDMEAVNRYTDNRKPNFYDQSDLEAVNGYTENRNSDFYDQTNLGSVNRYTENRKPSFYDQSDLGSVNRYNENRKSSFYDQSDVEPVNKNIENKRPSLYDAIKDQSDFVPNRYSQNPSLNNMKKRPNPFGDLYKNFKDIFKGDKYLDDSFVQGNPMIQPEQQQLRRQIPYGKSATGVRTQEVSQLLQPQRAPAPIQESRPSSVIYRPELKYKPHNVYRPTQNVDKRGTEVFNSSSWQNQFEEKKDFEAPKIQITEKTSDQIETEITEEMNDGEQIDDEVHLEEVKGKRDVRDETTERIIFLGKISTPKLPVELVTPVPIAFG